MTTPPRISAALGFLGIALASLAALAVALVAQHAFDIQPCPWCVMQRIVLLAVIVVAIGAAALARAAPRLGPGLGGLAVLGLACAGLTAAWYQHTVAAKQFSCAFTWADRMLMAWGLDAWWPGMFRVGATCADAAQATLLGLPFEVWGGAWFALVAVAAVALLLRARR